MTEAAGAPSPQHQPSPLESPPLETSARSCFSCHRSGHVSQNCPQWAGRCFRCRAHGHKGADCPTHASRSPSPRHTFAAVTASLSPGLTTATSMSASPRSTFAAVTASRSWSAARPSLMLTTCCVDLFSCAPSRHTVILTLFSLAPAFSGCAAVSAPLPSPIAPTFSAQDVQPTCLVCAAANGTPLCAPAAPAHLRLVVAAPAVTSLPVHEPLDTIRVAPSAQLVSSQIASILRAQDVQPPCLDYAATDERPLPLSAPAAPAHLRLVVAAPALTSLPVHEPLGTSRVAHTAPLLSSPIASTLRAQDVQPPCLDYAATNESPPPLRSTEPVHAASAAACSSADLSDLAYPEMEIGLDITAPLWTALVECLTCVSVAFDRNDAVSSADRKAKLVTKHAYHQALDKLRVCWCTVGFALTNANESVDFDKARLAFISLQDSLNDFESALEHYNFADSAEKGDAGCNLRDAVQELLVVWNVDLVDLISPELGADADSAENVINARLLSDYLQRGIVSDESQRELMEMIVHGQGKVAAAHQTTPPILANAVAIREANAFLLEDAVADKDAEDEHWEPEVPGENKVPRRSCRAGTLC